jgi:hypothetical protein
MMLVVVITCCADRRLALFWMWSLKLLLLLP